MVIGTKFGFGINPDGTRYGLDSRPAHIREVTDAALRRLKVETINFNGSADAAGLFPKFAPTGGFVSGLMGFAFDPDYRRNGVFYTLHLENPALAGEATPKAGVLSGLDASRFVVTKPIGMPANGQTLTREGVISEWTDSNIKNVTFEGSVREVMRVQLLNAIHPMSDLTFNPTAAPGSADWRVLYVSTGDGGTGERNDVSRLNPQRLDHFGGTIIRIIPDVRLARARRFSRMACATRIASPGM